MYHVASDYSSTWWCVAFMSSLLYSGIHFSGYPPSATVMPAELSYGAVVPLLCDATLVLLYFKYTMARVPVDTYPIRWYVYQWTLIRSDGTCTSGYLSDPMARVPVDTYPMARVPVDIYLIQWYVYQWTLIRSDGTCTSGHLSDGTCTSGWLSKAPSVPPIVVQYVVCGMYIKLSIHCMPFHPIYTK